MGNIRQNVSVKVRGDQNVVDPNKYEVHQLLIRGLSIDSKHTLVPGII